MAIKKRKEVRVSIGEANKLKIYSAIYEPIMELRVIAAKSGLQKEELDRRLYYLIERQWKSISQILKIKNP